MTGQDARPCPALFISAPASGQGKTTATAALARYHRGQGRKVRLFKTGPDFLDPMILEQASGLPVYQLDLWMGGESHCRQLLFAAAEADLILVEGAMGLYDGQPSSADLVGSFNIPVLAVIDAAAMAQTFGAIAYGLAHYRRGLPFAGVVANRVAGMRHAEMLAESLPTDVPLLGALQYDEALRLPDRHLGLVQAAELDDLNQRLDQAAAAIARTALTTLPKPVRFTPGDDPKLPASLRSLRIAIARDRAFSFIYPANLDVLRDLGAELIFFSPLANEPVPAADSVYLPGGYPELHLDRLANNIVTRESLRAHHAAGKPIVAECGGMLYLLESLTDAQGAKGEMAGLLPGHAVMLPRLANLGLQSVALPEGTLRGHTYHYSRVETPLTPLCHTQDMRSGGRGEAVYRQGTLHASYLHLYFPSNPATTARLFLP